MWTYMKSRVQKGFMFRGVNEAKYKMYNSAQRAWIENDLILNDIPYHNLINRRIIDAKSSNGNYFKKIGIVQDNDLAILSFLQHYEPPTPLLDFTYILSCPSSLPCTNAILGHRKLRLKTMCLYTISMKDMTSSMIYTKWLTLDWSLRKASHMKQ